MTPPPLLHI